MTDASVVLGWINPDYFAGGTLRLHRELAVEAVRSTVAAPLGLSLEAAALGIHRVVNNQMAEGIRLVSIRQGFDPRRFALVPVGGAGPVHGAALALMLGIRRILVPRYPGVMAATGLLVAPVEYEASAAIGAPLGGIAWPDVAVALDRLDAACAAAMSREAVGSAAVRTAHFADLCYAGQASHLEVAIDDGEDDPAGALERRFADLYTQVFGQITSMPVRLVAVRAVHSASFGGGFVFEAREGAASTPKQRRRVVLPDNVEAEVPIFDRDALPAGSIFQGPAIVEQVDTTVLVEPGWQCRVAAGGVLSMEWTGAAGKERT